MIDAPEKIWIEQDCCPYFYEESELAEAGSPVTEYIRADLCHCPALDPSAARELALEEAARNAAMYLATGFITCPRCGEDLETKNTDAEYALRAALSSPDHADAGKTWNSTHPSGGDRHGE